MTVETGFKVSDRVQDVKDGQRGTVRFVGEVPPTTGVWLGIEWDHPEIRGKHDGTHEGLKYFEAVNKDHKTPASFVRPAKVTGGISLAKAIMDRYGSVEGQTAGVDEDMLNNLCKDIGAPFVTVVGFDKVNKQQSDFAKLRTISVRKSVVSSLADNPDDLGALIPKAQSLDLSENLFSSWLPIIEIGHQLKYLKVLTLSCNRLSLPSTNDPIKDAFSKLEQLVMGEVGYTWPDLFFVASNLPKLQLLNCHSNLITEVSSFNETTAFHALVELNLNNNPLGDWSHIMKFAHLPNLITLFINMCKIKKIEFDPQLNDNECFPNLRCLCMTHNEIDNWLSFSNLDRLHLTDLRCRENPIIDSEKSETARQILIATIGSLSILNGTEIERTERYGADIDYLKRHGLEYLKAVKEETIETFREKYPRYQKLVAKYGAIDEEELVKKDTSLKSSLITVTLDCPDIDNFEKLSKKLTPTLTIQKLRLLLQRAINRKGEGALAHKLILTASSPKQPEIRVSLDNDMRDLFFYSIDDGDTIFISW